jgi:hypothetical protein
MTISWETLGTVDPRRVVDARLQLHWAAQAVSAPGRQLLEHRPDFSEQSLQWAGGPRALAQELVNGVWPFRSALRASPPAVVLLDANDRVTAEFPLDGHTLEEVYGWLEKEIPHRIGRQLLQPLQRPGEGLPEHGVGAGAGNDEAEHFSVIDVAAFSEMGRWFGNAHRLLTRVAERHPGASAVRCWPHHFDIAILISLDAGADPETARSIGVGLSPGEGTGETGRPHPYFYVAPWPYPKDRELPALSGGGVWNTEGWTGAVLETPALLRAGIGEAQAGQAERFVESAVAACLDLLARREEPAQERQDQTFAAQTERS